MTEEVKRCTYTHEVSTERFDDLSTDIWRCPHDAHPKTNYCPFHLPADHGARSEIDYETTFMTVVSAAGTDEYSEKPERTRIIGARFPSLSLRFTVVDGDHRAPIDLRESVFEGRIDASNTTIDHALWLSGSEFHSTVSFAEATIYGAVNVKDTRFAASLLFDEAELYALDLSDAVIEGSARFREANVDQTLTCRGATIDRFDLERVDADGDVNLTELETSARLRLDNADIGGQVAANRAILSNGLWAVDLTVSKGVAIGDTHIGGPVHLDDATLEGQSRVNAATFGDRTFLRDATVETLLVSSTTFQETAGFDGTTFDRAEFRGTSFHETAEFEATTFETLVFVPNRTPRYVTFRSVTIGDEVRIAPESNHGNTDVRWLDLRESKLHEGALTQPKKGSVVYDLAGAEVGDVSFEGTSRGSLLSWYNLRRTTFDGFDFGDYRRELDEADWRLHDLNPSMEQVRRSITAVSDSPVDRPEVLETTYLKARTEAANRGDNEAASRFFRHEMRWRRKRHLSQVRSGHSVKRRLQGLARGVYNWLLGAMTGHGELSRRVVYSSTFIIVVFAVVYRATYAAAFEGEVGITDYLIFSAQTFITFLLGTAPASSPLGLRILTVVEGFVGAFFVALFVFTLTRSVNR
ncbi:pentapeptide repeat-containing protein [Halorussus salinisoli]|uniref:pentapeptide repeat-containing protein n=1 Tax=Halorussus salinisoli TaxID=2558242 RepID=UPI0010C2403A|nr:pentapeptide repeat-containing protein [Halorussus salinisoli]